MFNEFGVVDELLLDSEFDEFEVLSYYSVFIVKVMQCFVSYVSLVDSEFMLVLFSFYDKLW